MVCGGCSKIIVPKLANPSVETKTISRGKLLCLVRNHSPRPVRFFGKATGLPYSLRTDGEDMWVFEEDYQVDRKRLVFTGEGRMHCDFVEVKEGIRYRYKCIRCGQMSAPLPKRTKRFLMPCLKDGIGDRFERFLHAIGIRIKCGGCNVRKSIMNDIDRKLFRHFRGPKDATYLD